MTTARSELEFGFTHSLAEALPGIVVDAEPTEFDAYAFVFRNQSLFEDLKLPKAAFESPTHLFSGRALPRDSRPMAVAYSGHQFGHFSPVLGDGRALLLGELVDREGGRQDLQLKGSGPTPFSRRGDGRASIGPALREALVAEAMHALGVSTTRVLAVATTGDQVIRRRAEPGAVLARVGKSHLRVGSLQFLAAHGSREQLGALTDYALARHFAEEDAGSNPAEKLLLGVARVQAELIASWMSVGFIHGVMNTDNVALSGETLDYGPCAFMDAYDPGTVFSSIDRGSRYAFGQQPGIGVWNLTRLGEALLPLLAGDKEAAVEMIEKANDAFIKHYSEAWLGLMCRKLGFEVQEPEQDLELVQAFLDWMQSEARDFTQTFRALSDAPEAELSQSPAYLAWHAEWLARRGERSAAEVAAAMQAINPIYVPRNHLVEAALDAAVLGDLDPFETLLALVRAPFTRVEGREGYEGPAPADFGPYQTFCGT